MAPVSPPLGWTCYSDQLRHSGNPAAPSATKTLVTRQWWKEALVTTYTYEIRVNGERSQPQPAGEGHYSEISTTWNSKEARTANVSIVRMFLPHGGGIIGIANIVMTPIHITDR